jgi:hypothetical protein
LVADDRYEEALDVAMIGSKAGTKAIEKLRSMTNPPVGLGNETTDVGSESVPKVDARAVLFGALPIMLRVASLVARGKEVASAVSRICVACRAIGIGSMKPEVWEAMANLFSDVFDQQHSLAHIHRESDRLGDLFGPVVRAIAYAGASVARDASLEVTLKLQVIVYRFAVDGLMARWSFGRLLLDPFVTEFWRNAIDQQGFRFRYPRAARAALDEAFSLPSAERPVAVLKSAAEGLGVRIDL